MNDKYQEFSIPLICSLGGSWAVIPELVCAVWPEVGSIYAADAPQVKMMQSTLDKKRPNCLWVVTTTGTEKAVDSLLRWWALLQEPFPIRVLKAECKDLHAQDDIEVTRELIYRAVLSGTPNAVLSLAGGRKTMSADLQRAGMAFGCKGMYHLIAPPPKQIPEPLSDPSPNRLLDRLPRETTDHIYIVLIGNAHPSELLALDPPITSEQYPLPETNILSREDCSPCLWRALQDRERDGSRLMANFHAGLAMEEHHENWRQLYRLSPTQIQLLRESQLNHQDESWLRRLPKADLHCHVGGALNLSAQHTVGIAVWDALRPQERDRAAATVAELDLYGDDWSALIRNHSIPRSHLTAGLWATRSLKEIEEGLYAPTEPRVGLARNHRLGFQAYERPGELSGSALLSHPNSLEPYARAVVDLCRAEGIWYLELRGSPNKYRPDDPVGWVADWREALLRAGAQCDHLDIDALSTRPRIAWISIVDRRLPRHVKNVIDTTLEAYRIMPGFVIGLDLAGDEAETAPEDIANYFRPAFEACLNITIHAGEGVSAERIWQAAYHLHADRIGHGLTLAENPELAARFRDRRICLELCPSSNREVVGYYDPAIRTSKTFRRYPLPTIWTDLRQPMTLCTDNPGISRTSLTEEYLAASRMSEDGISRWEALALMRQGMLHAFLPSVERESLLKAADHEVFNLVHGWIST